MYKYITKSIAGARRRHQLAISPSLIRNVFNKLVTYKKHKKMKICKKFKNKNFKKIRKNN